MARNILFRQFLSRQNSTCYKSGLYPSSRFLHQSPKLSSSNSQLQPVLNSSQSLTEYAKIVGAHHGKEFDQIILTNTNQVFNCDSLEASKTLVKQVQETNSSMKLVASDLEAATSCQILIVFPTLESENIYENSENSQKLANFAKDYAADNNIQVITDKARSENEKTIQQFQQKLDEIDQDLKPLEEIYERVVLNAAEKTDNYLVVFLGLSTVSFCSVARLTWWEYSWDILEPVAWALQSGSMLFWGWYYYVTRSESDMTCISNRIHDKKFRDRLEAEEFSVEKYNELVLARKKIEQASMDAKH